ncbi:hypothetical protein CIPAW_15G023700 [Carya illinoinensis]|uniref:Uncharacterized protein n=1 Tax=Carya illinoinensis TaxID=32201 RepID=A0A8T1NAQ9_CARIL|nr:hypothetical protein CIPAW_15G023700 [Carya illinoinensis]
MHVSVHPPSILGSCPHKAFSQETHHGSAFSQEQARNILRAPPPHFRLTLRPPTSFVKTTTPSGVFLFGERLGVSQLSQDPHLHRVRLPRPATSFYVMENNSPPPLCMKTTPFS